jgi:hypothetical protein
MKNLVQMVAALAAVGMFACVGGIDAPNDPNPDPDPDPDPDPTEKQGKVIYDRDIHPISRDLCGGCHNALAPSGNTSGFYDPNLATAYLTMTNVTAAVGDFTPTGSGFYAIVKAPGGHQGITGWTPDQDSKILNWLTVEINERAGQPPQGNPVGETPSAASERLIREWSGCMTIDDFIAAGMPNGWGNLNAQNNTQCRDCHATGGNFFLATDQPEFFFNGLTGATGQAISKYLLLQYFKVDLSEGVENAKVVINETSIQGVATGGPGHLEHPRFNPNNQGNNRGMPVLERFYNRTMAHVTAGTCGPPRLP